tara:strand:- start:212 stop:544 length:333 start_codon:yes stop_codon:yes gene_type:complete
MAYKIEYKGPDSGRWSKKPTKKTDSAPHAGMSDELDQGFRIVADKLEEIGLALDEFTTRPFHGDQRIRFRFDQVYSDGRWVEVNEFPSRVKKKWVKGGVVTWRDSNPIFN